MLEHYSCAANCLGGRKSVLLSLLEKTEILRFLKYPGEEDKREGNYVCQGLKHFCGYLTIVQIFRTNNQIRNKCLAPLNKATYIILCTPSVLSFWCVDAINCSMNNWNTPHLQVSKYWPLKHQTPVDMQEKSVWGRVKRLTGNIHKETLEQSWRSLLTQLNVGLVVPPHFCGAPVPAPLACPPGWGV